MASVLSLGVTLKDQALYICEAQNIFGKVQAEARLTVTGHGSLGAWIVMGVRVDSSTCGPTFQITSWGPLGPSHFKADTYSPGRKVGPTSPG